MVWVSGFIDMTSSQIEGHTMGAGGGLGVIGNAGRGRI